MIAFAFLARTSLASPDVRPAEPTGLPLLPFSEELADLGSPPILAQLPKGPAPPTTSPSGGLTSTLVIDVQTTTYQLIVPVRRQPSGGSTRRLIQDGDTVILGVAGRRDMWYVIRAFERQGKQPWREILLGDAPVLSPSGELTRSVQVKDGQEIKFEVSNDLNDHRVLARWCADFLARALVGKPLAWQDPRAAAEAVAFFTSFISPSLNLFGTSVAIGADIGAGDPAEAVRRLARALLRSSSMSQALAKVFAAGGLSATGSTVTALATIAAANAVINMPAWSELYRNAKAEPFIEEVLFKVSRRLVPGDEMARDTARQLSESVGTVWIYNVRFYDERSGRLSTGTYRAMNEGPTTFGGVQATHFTRQVELNPPLAGWDSYYKYPISDGGNFYSQSADISTTLGGWDIRASGRTQWMLNPPLIIDRGALSRGQQTTYSGMIEYTHGETRRHAPTTCRIKGQESVTVPAGNYSAVWFSLVAQQVQDYGMVLLDAWSVPGLGTVKMLERSPGHYWWEAELVRTEPGTRFPDTVARRPSISTATLTAALDAYEDTVRAKLKQDLEYVSRAYANAWDIQRARALADLFSLPLAIVNTAIGRLHIISDPGLLVGDLANAKNQLDLISKLFKIHTLWKSGNKFRLAITGPEYEGAVGAMLAEAQASPDARAYEATILLHLHGLTGRKSPAPIVIETAQGRQVIPNIKEFKAALDRLLAGMKTTILASSPPQEDALRAALAEVDRVAAHIKASRSRSEDLGRGITLGRIAGLEQMRMQALTAYDRSMKIEQVNTIISSLGATCVAISFAFPLGPAVTAKDCAYLSDLGALYKATTLAYESDGPSQVKDLPLHMLLSLPGEGASIWNVTRQLADTLSILLKASQP